MEEQYACGAPVSGVTSFPVNSGKAVRNVPNICASTTRAALPKGVQKARLPSGSPAAAAGRLLVALEVL